MPSYSETVFVVFRNYFVVVFRNYFRCIEKLCSLYIFRNYLRCIQKLCSLYSVKFVGVGWGGGGAINIGGLCTGGVIFCWVYE